MFADIHLLWPLVSSIDLKRRIGKENNMLKIDNHFIYVLLRGAYEGVLR